MRLTTATLGWIDRWRSPSPGVCWEETTTGHPPREFVIVQMMIMSGELHAVLCHNAVWLLVMNFIKLTSSIFHCQSCDIVLCFYGSGFEYSATPKGTCQKLFPQIDWISDVINDDDFYLSDPPCVDGFRNVTKWALRQHYVSLLIHYVVFQISKNPRWRVR